MTDFTLLPVQSHPIDNIESVIEKMGIELEIEGQHFRFFLTPCAFVIFLDQFKNLLIHLVVFLH
ncbi:hypothetical protein D3C81_1917170 [compost metagenome]